MPAWAAAARDRSRSRLAMARRSARVALRKPGISRSLMFATPRMPQRSLVGWLTGRVRLDEVGRVRVQCRWRFDQRAPRWPQVVGRIFQSVFFLLVEGEEDGLENPAYDKEWPMCRLAILYRVCDDAPLGIGANREEYSPRGGDPPRPL